MKLLYFDTESTDLSASWGRILCCSFVEQRGEPYTFRGDRRPYVGKTRIDDSKLVVAIRDELERGAREGLVIGWNCILHDIPLVNARLALVGERPCRFPEKRVLDLMFYAGGASLKIGSRKLDNVAKFFHTTQKTPLDGEIWQLAGAGDKGAMDQVVEHCEADVLVTRDQWPHLAPMVKKLTLPLAAWWRWAEEIEVA